MLEQDTLTPVRVVLRYNAASVLLPRDQELLVGRGPDCFISLDDPNVSRIHFRIIVVGDTVIIEDSGSKNGTHVNGERIESPHQLRDGDEIAVGGRVFVVGFVSAARKEAVDVTPAEPQQQKQPTLPGVGAVARVAIGERCPRCREHVPLQATCCTNCGFEWRRGSKRAPTSQEDAVEPPMQRRRDKRYPVSIPTRFASSSWEGQGSILNLSTSGAFVSAPRSVSVGSTCVLEVRSERDAIITLEGFVRHAIHQGDRGMGIEFTGPSPEAVHWIRNRLPVPH
jgi:pSer/pThr/pTyr-binding forkhead associated (FHA) protein